MPPDPTLPPAASCDDGVAPRVAHLACRRAADRDRSLARAARLPVVDVSALLLDLVPRIEQRIAPRATLTLDLGAARVPLRGALSELEDLVCLLVAQACASLPGGRGAIVLTSERQELGAEALATFVPGARMPGSYLVFGASAPDGDLGREPSRRLFDPDYARRHPGHGPGLAGALAAVREQGGALRVRCGRRCGLRIALALPAAGARDTRAAAARRVR